MGKRTKAEIAEKDQHLAQLRKDIRPGTVVYTVMRHCAKSGMMRVIDVYTIVGNQPCRWSWSVAKAIGAKYNRKHEGIEVGGCGMDMGFHLVNNLSYALHGMDSVGPDAKKHSDLGRPFKATRKQYRAGYSLEHRWL